MSKVFKRNERTFNPLIDSLASMSEYDKAKINEKQIDEITHAYDVFKNPTNYSLPDAPDRDLYFFKDFLANENFLKYLPPIINTVVYESAAQNMTILPRCFKKMNLPSDGTVTVLDMINFGEVPIFKASQRRTESLSDGFGGGAYKQFKINTESWAAELAFDEELRPVLGIDMVQMWIRAANRAFARNKEEKAIGLLQNAGICAIDNVNPELSELGSTTGLDFNGKYNGALTYNDMIEILQWSRSILHVNPDTMLMNPMAYRMFLYDPQSNIDLALGQRNPIVGGYNQGWETLFGGLGERMRGGTLDPTSNHMGRTGTMSHVITPNWLNADIHTVPNGPFRGMYMIVSDLIANKDGDYNYTATTVGSGEDAISYTPDSDDTTKPKFISDIYLIDSNNCGYFASSGDTPKMKNWNEPRDSLNYIMLQERWGMNLVEMGLGLITLKNIVEEPYYTFENSRTISGNLPKANGDIAILE